MTNPKTKAIQLPRVGVATGVHPNTKATLQVRTMWRLEDQCRCVALPLWLQLTNHDGADVAEWRDGRWVDGYLLPTFRRIV